MSTAGKPLISVAIVSYQHHKFIAECLDSVLKQDYDRLEIVVADDGSTDGTQEIIRDYDRRFPGVFVLRLSSRNQGITTNCNAAHSACSGKYIAWMAGDDLLLPGKISAQVAYMEAHPDCYISYHNVEIFNSTSGKTLGYYNHRGNKFSGDVRLLIQHGTFNCACACMVRHDKAPAHGFDAELPVASDWYYWIEILLKGGRIEYLDKVLGRYRRHESNVTNNVSPHFNQAINDHLRTCEKVIAFNPAYASLLRRQLSNIYRTGRRVNYGAYLWKSLSLNPFNWRALIMWCVYTLSFHKVKL
ncbi:MAG TPA: glycosyltransferase [Cyclobacteriaceae bacterium]|nr:glycosyltransferase [Cyclobacteriaceae bacterium]